MIVLEVLRRARERLTPPERWLKGAYAKDSSGLVKDPTSKWATCWCSLGAIRAEADVVSEYWWSYQEAVRALEGLLPRRVDPVLCGGNLVDFNDAPTTTHAEVLALFDAAIASLTAGAGTPPAGAGPTPPPAGP